MMYTQRILNLFAVLLLIVGAGSPLAAQEVVVPLTAEGKEPEKADVPRRRVFVLHSGIHTILANSNKNHAALMIQDGLLKRGVEQRDIILLDNPFPSASWRSLFPLDGLTMFLDLLEPGSRVSQDNYRRLYGALENAKVAEADELIWVGHSAGGQMGMTMAHLGLCMDKHPELAKKCKQCYKFDMVVTLGTPLGGNIPMSDVKLRHYYSPDDKVVNLASKYGKFAVLPLGYRDKFCPIPQKMPDQCKVRVFYDVPHQRWDESDRVVSRILAEATEAGMRPLWHSSMATGQRGLSLSQLLCQVLEEENHIAIEDPPRR